MLLIRFHSFKACNYRLERFISQPRSQVSDTCYLKFRAQKVKNHHHSQRHYSSTQFCARIVSVTKRRYGERLFDNQRAGCILQVTPRDTHQWPDGFDQGFRFSVNFSATRDRTCSSTVKQWLRSCHILSRENKNKKIFQKKDKYFNIYIFLYSDKCLHLFGR